MKNLDFKKLLPSLIVMLSLIFTVGCKETNNYHEELEKMHSEMDSIHKLMENTHMDFEKKHKALMQNTILLQVLM